MMTISLILFLFILALYLSAILWLKIGLTRLQRQVSKTGKLPGELPSVSVIVSARNESQNLPRLIHCLVQQNYPEDKFDICIVDDRSEDNSQEILQLAEQIYPNLKTIRIDDTLSHFAPKKRALDRAIRATSGEIILLTDADCTPHPTWIASMVTFYRRQTALVAGYSPYRFDQPVPVLIRGMLSLDNFSLGAIAAGSIGWGRPLTATGTNLSYRRSAYFNTGGFESIAQWVSGDDDLFMHEIAHKKVGKFSFALHPQAYMPAAAPTSWQKFWHQRIRYASKSRHYSLPIMLGLVAAYIFNFIIFFGSLSLLIMPSTWGLIPAFAWFLKAIAEYSFLRQSTRAFQEQKLLKYFIPTQLMHPLYIILFGFLGLFARFQWKGETFQKTLEPESLLQDS